jgi:4-amino-4-deoxy-L-arabinose transferase-like glycosyltransferase
LDLTVPRDEVTYMLLGRSISAALGTATIPLVYRVARHVSGRLAGVFAAFFLAFSVIHLRESHFFSLDVSMTFFTVVAWCFLVRTVERGDTVGAAGSALGLGLGVASKYSAAFIGPMIGIAELLSPFGPRGLTPIRPWIRVVVRTALTGLAGIAIFLLLDPLVVRYFDKFQSDIKVWVIDPLSGTSKPEWIAQFADVNAIPYWFTNLLWWGLGPALEIWAIAGVLWLLPSPIMRLRELPEPAEQPADLH